MRILNWLFHTHTWHELPKEIYLFQLLENGKHGEFAWVSEGYTAGHLYYKCCKCSKLKSFKQNNVVLRCDKYHRI